MYLIDFLWIVMNKNSSQAVSMLFCLVFYEKRQVLHIYINEYIAISPAETENLMYF